MTPRSNILHPPIPHPTKEEMRAFLLKSEFTPLHYLSLEIEWHPTTRKSLIYTTRYTAAAYRSRNEALAVLVIGMPRRPRHVWRNKDLAGIPILGSYCEWGTIVFSTLATPKEFAPWGQQCTLAPWTGEKRIDAYEKNPYTRHWFRLAEDPEAF